VHLEIQSISEKNSNLSHIIPKEKVVATSAREQLARKNHRGGISNDRQRPHNMTSQEFNNFGTPTSSEHSEVKTLNKTGLDSHPSKSTKKGHKKGKSKKKTKQT
jgi:hypothetical protein